MYIYGHAFYKIFKISENYIYDSAIFFRRLRRRFGQSLLILYVCYGFRQALKAFSRRRRDFYQFWSKFERFFIVETLFWTAKCSNFRLRRTKKTIYILVQKTKFSKFSKTIYIPVHIYEWPREIEKSSLTIIFSIFSDFACTL